MTPTFARILRLSDPKYLYSVVALGLLAGVFAWAQLWIIQWLVDAVAGGQTVTEVLLVLGALLVVGLLSETAQSSMSLRGELAAERVFIAMSGRMARHASARPLNDFDSAEFLNDFEYQQQNVLGVPIQGAHNLVSLVTGVGALIGGALALWNLGPVYVLALVLGLVPVAVGSVIAAATDIQFDVETSMERRRLGYLSWLMTSREGQLTVRGPGLVDKVIGLLANSGSAIVTRMRANLRRRWWILASSQVVTTAVIVLFVAGLIWLLDGDQLTVPSLTVLALSLLQLKASGQGILFGLAGIWDTEKRLRDSPGMAPPSEVAGPSHCDALKSVSVLSVDMAYPEAKHPALIDVGFSLEVGEIVALVGPNGAGKSTLAKILSGALVPDRGEVSTLPFDQPRKAGGMFTGIHFVQQDPLPLQLPVATVLGFDTADPDAMESRWPEIERMLRINEILDRLPAGPASELGRFDEGVGDLSIGQWQRILLARSLLSDDSLLILDEPTAFVDKDAEAGFMELLRSRRSEIGVLLITHSERLINFADRVVPLDDGRLVDHGTLHTDGQHG